jgi:hypothetical protein
MVVATAPWGVGGPVHVRGIYVGCGGPARKRKEGCSFLKKRTKKLFPALRDAGVAHRTKAAQPFKSFLLLFFKKEALPFT